MEKEKQEKKKKREPDVIDLAFIQGMIHALYSVGFNHACSIMLGNAIQKALGLPPFKFEEREDTPNIVRVKLATIDPNLEGYDGNDPAGELKGLDAGLAILRATGFYPGKAQAVRSSLEKRLKNG